MIRGSIWSSDEVIVIDTSSYIIQGPVKVQAGKVIQQDRTSEVGLPKSRVKRKIGHFNGLDHPASNI